MTTKLKYLCSLMNFIYKFSITYIIICINLYTLKHPSYQSVCFEIMLLIEDVNLEQVGHQECARIHIKCTRRNYVSAQDLGSSCSGVQKEVKES
jgi:hypothetical protein